jgi:hypothetical protein
MEILLFLSGDFALDSFPVREWRDFCVDEERLCLDSVSSDLLFELLNRIESMENADFFGDMNDTGIEVVESVISSEFVKVFAYDISAFI